jgi:hypothetical protein
MGPATTTETGGRGVTPAGGRAVTPRRRHPLTRTLTSLLLLLALCPRRLQR